IVLLVEIGAGFLPMADRYAPHEPAVAIVDRLRRLGAEECAAPRFEPLLAARRAFGAFVDAARREQLCERRDDLVPPALSAGGQKLTNEMAGVSVDDESGHAGRFGAHETAGSIVAEAAKPPAKRARALEAPPDQRRVDRRVRIEAHYARADLRRRRVRGPCEETAAGVDDIDRLSRSRRAFDRRDRSGEDPRMPAPQRSFAPR